MLLSGKKMVLRHGKMWTKNMIKIDIIFLSTFNLKNTPLLSNVI
jgi:hypothetical protein